MGIAEQLTEEMKKLASQAGASLKLPPPVFATLGCEFTALEPGQRLAARVPYDEKFANPLGFYQGGVLAAALDNVWGPLSYMVFQGPSVTIDLNCSFIRPFTPEDGWAELEATVTALTKNLLFMDGKARSGKTGKLLAFGRTQCMKVQPRGA